MKRIAIFFLFLLLPALCLAGEKVYTNADLKPPPPNKSTSYNSDSPQQQRQNFSNSNGQPQSNDAAYSHNDMNKTPPTAFNPVQPSPGPPQGTIEQQLAEAFARVTLFMLIVIGIPFLIWLICLIDVLRNEFTGNNKIIWFLVVFFLPVIGSILYFFIGTDQKKKPEDDEEPVTRLI